MLRAGCTPELALEAGMGFNRASHREKARPDRLADARRLRLSVISTTPRLSAAGTFPGSLGNTKNQEAV